MTPNEQKQEGIRKRDLIITVLRDEIKDRERTIKQTRKETAKEIFDEIDVLLQKEIHWDYDTWDTFLPNLKELRRKFE